MQTERYFPHPCEDGGWTIAYRNEDERVVSLRFCYYTSVAGREGRQMAQAHADEQNRLVEAQSIPTA